MTTVYWPLSFDYKTTKPRQAPHHPNADLVYAFEVSASDEQIPLSCIVGRKSIWYASYVLFNEGNRLATHPQFRQISLAVYVGVLIIGVLDWVLGRPPSTMVPLASSVRFAIFCVALVLLIGMELGRQSFSSLNQDTQNKLYHFALISLSGIVIAISSQNYAQLLLLIAILFAELTFQRPIRIATILATFTILFLRMAFGPRRDFISTSDLQNLMMFGVAMLLIMMLARLIKQESSQRQHLEQLNDELKSSTEQLAELAVINERNRLARDIHDSLGHHLAAVSIQLEMGKKLYKKDPDATLNAMEAASKATKEALNDVRTSVQALRETENSFELEPAINLLIDRIQTDKLDISYQVEGDETRFSQMIRMVLFRAIQEGLTNVHKHAAASRINLWVQYGDDEAHLRIVDNGKGFDASAVAQGFGLRGVRERVSILGGTFEIDSRQDSGTVLDIMVPNGG